ncbi:glycosyltransferase family 4 protein [uncultured Alistipes sp.]|uniref:glycosyltransferase family 4 protein n=1 Tax=uncultured Alistipes sp. TaxID=538949 RepID=UPI00260C8D8A|nr:glycosyltransferase family 4 protein [uncultured Alistipes sp.]
MIDAGVSVRIIPYPTRRMARWIYPYRMLKSFILTAWYLRREKFDVIHVHTPILSFIPRFAGYKFVTTTHVAKLSLGFFHRIATEEIAISREVYDDCLNRGVAPEHLTLIHNGVDRKFSEPVADKEREKNARKLAIPSDKTVIGFVGTLCPRKGLDILLTAMARLKSEGYRNYHIVLLGNYDKEEDRAWLREVVAETDHEAEVSIFGYDTPRKFYPLFDIFVLPSRIEGFPLVVLEALLSRCCVVRSGTEGAEEQIENGKTGFIFENENPDSLAEVLRALLDDPTLRADIAAAGQAKALREFTSDTMTQKMLEVYRKAVNRYRI